MRWVPGTAAADVGPAGRGPAADGLADFLLALHVPADTGVPVNPFRGVPLLERDTAVVERLRDRERYPQAAALRAVWAQACAAKAWDGPPMMLHGDLHPGNVLLAGRSWKADLGNRWQGLPQPQRPIPGTLAPPSFPPNEIQRQTCEPLQYGACLASGAVAVLQEDLHQG
ncbi:phosphotransferase [Arthrobacter sp. Leaf69]|uniref:phosphotransferase n=1 Tax=Arthrobacter sp. Leaf69 TaxID=1736232 RepID=UPI001F176A3C|nr:phosphotransferase [Arthrobacter sp. Leaf69]